MNALDSLRSLPFRYELLAQLTRSQTLVLSAFIYAARLHPAGKWFRLSDEAIIEQTGLSRATVWRCKSRLKALGLIDQWQNRNTGYYRITEEQMNRILDIAKTTMAEQVARVLASFDEPARALALTIQEITGARPAFTWKLWLARMIQEGVSAEELALALQKTRERGFQVLNAAGAWRAVLRHRKAQARARKSNSEAKKIKRAFYHYVWDAAAGEYYRVPLPDGATQDIIDPPEARP